MSFTRFANLLSYKKPHRWNKTKLPMTGFECFDIFVIRCSGKPESRRTRPAIDAKNESRFVKCN